MARRTPKIHEVFVLGGLTWTPARLDRDGQVKEHQKVLLGLKHASAGGQAILDFVAQKGGQILVVRITPPQDVAEPWTGQAQISGASWKPVENEAHGEVTCKLEVTSSLTEPLTALWAMRLQMGECQESEAAIAMAPFQAELSDAEAQDE